MTQIVTNFLMLVLVVITFVDYFLTLQQCDQVQENIRMIHKSN
jgi:hypothetical protein